MVLRRERADGVDRHRQVPNVLQGDGLSCARGPDGLRGEGQGGRREIYRRSRPVTGKRQSRVRRRVAGDCDRGSLIDDRARVEGHVHRARGGRGQAGRTVVRLREISGQPACDCNAADVERASSVFFRTEDFGALVAFTGTFGNARWAGVKVTWAGLPGRPCR